MKKNRGFTLIELMIVVAVIGALAILALPSYLNQTRKARRSEVEGAIQQIVLFEERFRADCTTYADTFGGTCAAGSTATFPALNASYTGSYYTIANPSNISGTTYTIAATAKSTGGQTKDSASGTGCSTLYAAFGVDAAVNAKCLTTTTAAGKLTMCPEPCWSK